MYESGSGTEAGAGVPAYRIRTIEPGDLMELGKLYVQLCGQEPDYERMKSVYMSISANPMYYLLGAEHNGVLAGSVMGIVCYDLVNSCSPFMVIENVIVAESCRGLGIGKALMQRLERIAREEGCAYIIFVSGAARKDAHQFYESLGYRMDRARGFKKEL